jgi:hypothetical protein
LLSSSSDDESSVESEEGLRLPAHNNGSLREKRSLSVSTDGDNELSARKNKRPKTMASGVSKSPSPTALLGLRNSKSINDGESLSVVLEKDDEQKNKNNETGKNSIT